MKNINSLIYVISSKGRRPSRLLVVETRVGRNPSRWSGLALLSVVLRRLCGVVFLLGMLCASINVYAASNQEQRIAASDQSVDAVVVLDNVSQIGPHDPNSNRFAAASLFVDLASDNDRIGTLEISSSQTPTNHLGYHSLVPMDKGGKGQLKQTFAADAQAGIDPQQTAYFTPALKAAGDMLDADKGSDKRRYVIIVTDTLAASGDTNACPGAPQFHNWYCAVQDLEQKNISVVLLAFFSPTSDPAEFQPTQDYISQHGGIAEKFSSGANLGQDLATQYINIFSAIHQDILVADVKGAPPKIDIDRSMGSIASTITFVALGSGNNGMSIQNPTKTQVANSNQGDDYHSTGSIYWLQRIANGRLDGEWQLSYGNTPPSNVMVILKISAYLALLQPALSLPNSAISARYVPVGTSVLDVQLTDSVGQPLTQVPLSVVAPNCCKKFNTDDIPSLVDSQPGDFSATVAFAGEGDYTLGIGMGNPIQPGIYLTKQFTLHAVQDLQTLALQVPPSSSGAPLDKGVGVPVSINGVSNPSMGQASLSLFERPPGGSWQQFGNATSQNGSVTATGTFPLEQGCGALYAIVAEEKVSGNLNGKQYEYYTYDIKQYSGFLKTIFTGNAHFISSTDLSWLGQSEVTWQMSFTSTTCNGDGATGLLNLTLQSKDSNAPQMTVDHGTQYTVVSPDVVSIRVPHGSTPKVVQLSAAVGTCGPLLLPPDRSATFTLKAQNAGQAIPLVLSGDTQKDVTCPWIGTWFLRDVPIIFWPLPLIVVRHLLAIRRRYSRKLRLAGGVDFITNSPDLSEPGTSLPDPNSAEISSWSRLSTWYLDYKSGNNGSDGTYKFARRLGPNSLIEFSINGDRMVTMVATNRSKKIPQFEDRDGYLESTKEYPCAGQRLRIDNDIIIPDLNVHED